MKCIKPKLECRFRDVKGLCRWNCQHDIPPSECETANASWGCPFSCYFEANEYGCTDKEMGIAEADAE